MTDSRLLRMDSNFESSKKTPGERLGGSTGKSGTERAIPAGVVEEAPGPGTASDQRAARRPTSPHRPPYIASEGTRLTSDSLLARKVALALHNAPDDDWMTLACTAIATVSDALGASGDVHLEEAARWLRWKATPESENPDG